MSLNRVILCGMVEEEPDFINDGIHAQALEVKLKINRYDIGKEERVSFLIMDDFLTERALSEIQEGDFIQMEGKLTTTDYTRTVPVICPHCQQAVYKSAHAERTDITCTDFNVMRGVDFSSAPGYNRCYLMGNICTPINYREATATCSENVKYKIGVNRKTMKHPKDIADYPFVVSFRDEAKKAKTILNPTALVCIEGSIQQREVTQTVSMACERCYEEAAVPIMNIVREVITVKTHILTRGNHEDYPMQWEMRENGEEIITDSPDMTQENFGEISDGSI